MSRKISHCHKYVAKIAKELARASYGELMSDNLLFSAWKNQYPEDRFNPKKLEDEFVRRKWGMYIEAARATLVGLLQQPNNPNIDDKAKEEIMEILALDSSLIRGRVKPQQVAGILKPN